jgi:hypothetical protein
VAGKLPRWKRKSLNKSRRFTLVNSVLSAVVLYHMTVFPLSKWAIKKIDKIQRNFLWHGSEDVRGDPFPVNWKRVQRLKKLDDLEVLDLQKFNRALRLHYQWYKWREPNKPWSEMKLNHNETEGALF